MKFTKQYKVCLLKPQIFAFSSPYNWFSHAQLDHVPPLSSWTLTSLCTGWSMSMRCSDTHTGHGYKIKPNQAPQGPSASLSRWKSDLSGQNPADLHYLMTWAWDLADEILWNWPFGQIFPLLMNHKCVVSGLIWTYDHSETWIWFFLIPQQRSAAFRQEAGYMPEELPHFFPLQVHLESPVHPHQKAPRFEPRALLLWG